MAILAYVCLCLNLGLRFTRVPCIKSVIKLSYALYKFGKHD